MVFSKLETVDRARIVLETNVGIIMQIIIHPCWQLG